MITREQIVEIVEDNIKSCVRVDIERSATDILALIEQQNAKIAELDTALRTIIEIVRMK